MTPFWKYWPVEYTTWSDWAAAGQARASAATTTNSEKPQRRYFISPSFWVGAGR